MKSFYNSFKPGACILVMAILATALASAQGTGVVLGNVIDKRSKQTLPGAVVYVQGTTIGTNTDINGAYRLVNIPISADTLVYSFLGYRTLKMPISLEPGSPLRLNVELDIDAVQMQEAVVYGQASGQLAAINQQLKSNTIVSVVSAEKIQELPDQNAAEAVGRLPGVSVQRENGEGQKVVVRGLSPKFNSVTINGIRIPATSSGDRSVDLSMISPEALGGIEVFKALRPDMDADAIGGTVNFVMRKTASEPTFGARIQTGYNDQEQIFGLWKFDLYGGKRFFDNKFGVSISANGQKADRSSDNLRGEYQIGGENADGTARIIINNLNLADRLETRYRYSGGLNFDYQFNDLHSIVMTNTIGYIRRDEVTRRKRYRLNDNYLEYDLRDRQRETIVFSSALNGYHQLGEKLLFTWQGSTSASLQNTLYDHAARWRELSAFGQGVIDTEGPEAVPGGADNDVESMFLKDARFDLDNVDDVMNTFRGDFKYDYKLNDFNGYLKAGASIRDQERSNDVSRVWTGTNVSGTIGADEMDRYTLAPNGEIAIFDFIDSSFVAPDFLNNDAFGMGIGSNETDSPGLDREAIDAFYQRHGDQYVRDDRLDLESYLANEQIQSVYLMNETNWNKLMVMGGARIERTLVDYTATVGLLQKLENEEWVVRDPETVRNVQDYQELLPMLHLRYKFTDWFDVRVAATKTLARPDFTSLVPFQIIDDQNRTARIGNTALVHTTVWNYDLFLSFYGDKLGLFTIGAYYKELENVEYQATFRLIEPGDALNGYQIRTQRNALGTSFVRGLELDYQTNFRWLPKPFDGIVLSANLSFINSTTYYQFFDVFTQELPPFETIVIDGERRGTLPGQSDFLANFSLGYEKKGFSGRISMVHQGEALFAVGSRAEADEYTVATTRFDLALSQKINKSWMVFLNLNNITNQREAAFFGEERFSTNLEYFGFTADVGVRYKFNRRENKPND